MNLRDMLFSCVLWFFLQGATSMEPTEPPSLAKVLASPLDRLRQNVQEYWTPKKAAPPAFNVYRDPKQRNKSGVNWSNIVEKAKTVEQSVNFFQGFFLILLTDTAAHSIQPPAPPSDLLPYGEVTVGEAFCELGMYMLFCNNHTVTMKSEQDKSLDKMAEIKVWLTFIPTQPLRELPITS